MAMVDAVLADGRTTLRFRTRGDLIKLVKRKPEKVDEERHVRCWALWHREQETWEPARMALIRPASIAFIRVVEPAEREVFTAEFPDAAPREYADPAPAPAAELEQAA